MDAHYTVLCLLSDRDLLYFPKRWTWQINYNASPVPLPSFIPDLTLHLHSIRLYLTLVEQRDARPDTVGKKL